MTLRPLHAMAPRIGRSRAMLAFAAVVAAAPRASAQSFSQAFDRMDREAQTIVWYYRCFAAAPDLQGEHVLTSADTADHPFCYRSSDGRAILAFISTDSTWKHPTRFFAFDTRARQRITTPLDTADMLTLLRAQRYAQWLAAKVDSGRYLPPVAYRSDTVIHVWLVPASVMPFPIPSTGGERHYVFPADAKKPLRVDSVPPLRSNVRPDRNGWIIDSMPDSLPTRSAMLLANMLTVGGGQATIVLPTRVAVLLGRAGAWVFMPNKKP